MWSEARPLRLPATVLAAAAFLLGSGASAVQRGLQPAYGDAALALALCLGLAALLAPARAGLVACALCLGLARGPEPPAPSAVATAAARPVELDGRLLRWKPAAGGGVLGVLDRLRTRDGRPLDVPERTLEFHTPQSAALPALGTWLRVAGVLNSGARAPRLERSAWLTLAAPPQRPTALARLRHGVRLRLLQRLPAAEAGLACAMLLGDPGGAPEALAEAYRRLGLLHILAVSGAHLWLYDAALRRLLAGRARLLRLPALTVIALLAGGAAPVMRAWSAVVLHDLLALACRGTRPAVLWASALWVENALLPARPADVGLLLSYAATAGLLAVAGVERPWWKRCLWSSAAAFAATAPWLHALQGTIEPWTIVLTPLLAPLFPLRVALQCASLLPGCAGASGAALQAVGVLEGAILAAAERLPASPWAIPQVPTLAVALPCALLLLAGLGRARRNWWWLPAAALCWIPAPRAPGLLVLPVGHGLAVVVAGQERSLLFDCGSAELRPRRLLDGVLLPELARRRWPLPRAAIASHPDADHTNALDRLLQRHGCTVLEGEPGSVRKLERLHPWHARLATVTPARPGDRNGRGPVLDLRWGRFRAVLCGDQHGHALRQLTGLLPPGPIDVLLLPHHGLTTDGLPELLAHLRPRAAWASCGPGDWPLPAAALLRRHGVALHSTLNGALAWP